MTKRPLYFLMFMLVVSLAWAKPEMALAANNEGRVTKIVGNVYTPEPMPGLDVDIYCRELYLATANANNHGDFTHVTDKDNCGIGDEVYIQVELDGIFKSQSIEVEYNTPGQNLAQIPSVGVPEYSALTLGLAVVAGGLGFVMLRKR